jgi:HlyD family secretion protein
MKLAWVASTRGQRIILACASLAVGLALSACSVFSQATPTPLPTVVLGDPGGAPRASATNLAGTPAAPALQVSSSGVTASGVIAPAREAQLASTTGGLVESVNVAVGDRVQAGQVLVKLSGSQQLAAQVEAARLELLTAQQALKSLQDNAGPARTAAELRLANAQKALDDAQKKRTSKQYRNGSQSSIDAAQADLILAEDHLKQTEDIYGAVAANSENDVNRATALSALAAAQKARDKALANLNYLLALPNKIDVEQADAVLQSAQAEAQAAQEDVNRLKNGPDPDALALAQQRVKNAQVQIDAGQAALANLELKAPFDAVVSRVNVTSGGYATPAQPILALADLQHLQVKTTDLSERDVPAVQPGQPVSVFVKALNQNIAGKVKEISPLADTLGGDVVYQTTIDLDEQPAGLRAGMSVEVSFGEKQ